MFQHTATRRWLLNLVKKIGVDKVVSTHSHPKVAATVHNGIKRSLDCFNTQPPEGGCVEASSLRRPGSSVSTHSHPKVAAPSFLICRNAVVVSTHSHPKVAASIHIYTISKV